MCHRLWAVVVVSVALLVSACGPTTQTQRSTGPKVMTFIQATEPKLLDPSAGGLVHDDNAIWMVFDALARNDEQLVTQPQLALSWKNLEADKWEVKLRTGVKFTNGELFNADAVVESFKWLTRKDAIARGNLNRVKNVERLDDFTVRFTTTTPDPRFRESLVKMLIMPTGVLRSNPESLGEHPIGTGPFKLVEWVKGERIVFEANKDYWRGAPKMDRIIFKAVPEPSARIAALQSGQADLVVNVPPESVDSLAKGRNTQVIAGASTRGITFIFNSKLPPFNEVRVRQAVNYAVDKDSLIRNILGGKALPQLTTSYPANTGHNPDIKPYPYDPEKAKRLLAEAGYPNGFEIDFSYPSGRWLKDVEVSQAVAGMLEKVGIRTKQITGEYGAFFSGWLKGDYKGMTMIGSQNEFDAAGSVQYFFYSKQSGPGYQYSGDPKIDAFYEQQIGELDPAKREKLLHDMESYIHDQAYWLFMYFQNDIYGASKTLKWTPPKNERVAFWAADFQ